MSLQIFCVGKLKDSWLEEGCHEYLTRIKKKYRIEVHEITSEEEVISKWLKPRRELWVLDEKGKLFDTKEFSTKLASCMQQSAQGVGFLIGGANGTSTQVKQKASQLWSISPLTFPHRIVRLLLLEQLYRAFSYLNNEPYHRE